MTDYNYHAGGEIGILKKNNDFFENVIGVLPDLLS
jgi:hypothetical protein